MSTGRWDRQHALRLAEASGLPPVDLSLGLPADPPPPIAAPVVPTRAPAAYPLSAGSDEFRAAAAGYLDRRFGVAVAPAAVAACVGAKEFIGTLPALLRRVLGRPERDVVLVPALGYPTYVAGAALAGAHVHRIPMDTRTGLDLESVPPAVTARALCLWVNSPANPTGAVAALPAVAEWGRRHGVVVVSDETYGEFTWDRPPTSVLAGGADGVLAVHSLAKRSNAPGLRVGFYTGDADLVTALADLRRATGLIASESAQATGARLLADNAHADRIRERTRHRLRGLLVALADAGLPGHPPAGGPFVWLPAPGGDGLDFAERAARTAGLVVAPGSEYGPAGHGHVRLAAVRDPAEVAPRLAMLGATPVARTKNRRTP